MALVAETHDWGGGAPWLVLLHGGGMNLWSWDSTIDALDPAFSICAVDLPGHGRSDDLVDPSFEAIGRQVSDVLDELAITNPVLVGWSLGWPVALCCAHWRADVVGLVSVDGAVLPYAEEVASFASSKSAFVEFLAKRATPDPDDVDAAALDAAIVSESLASSMPEPVVRRCWSAFDDGHRYRRRPRAADGVALTEANWDLDLTGLWSSMRAPILAVVATGHPPDVLELHRRGARLRAAEHGATEIVELDAPHAIPHAAAEALAELIGGFAARAIRVSPPSYDRTGVWGTRAGDQASG